MIAAAGSPAARSGPSSPRRAHRAGSTGRRRRAGPWSGSRRRRRRTRRSRSAPSCTPARARGRRSVCPTGEDDGYVWTRKRPVAVECDVRIGERRIRCEARGVEDESCGYHPHHTVWDWSAGVGETTDGREVAWNLVSGHQRPAAGLRAGDLGRRRADASPGRRDLRRPRGDRARRRPARVHRRGRAQQGGVAAVGELLATASRSAPSPAPCPAGSSSPSGLGVMEHHDAHW